MDKLLIAIVVILAEYMRMGMSIAPTEKSFFEGISLKLVFIRLAAMVPGIMLLLAVHTLGRNLALLLISAAMVGR